ncbi:UBP-type zinc finger domain-containing protein [Pyxidicoccus xibeiensis]|uniref:UBP-type zinc finger domain-containing protein n=1 Tax=Pyxidicoccus xibeiensis TaxID=2906759 RepID=UPI0020A7E9EB|nr:UBP-type zinc finger domain-containing protein [Pyxidicoccus xibeiensis]MCP3136652.1 UBP-type zinc finger domain-containing protein [Pyxidicoccus xibeiensis]
MAADCEHVEQAGDPAPRAVGCEECLSSGSSWVHLRRCLSCGHIGCCDSSPNTHATKHFHRTHHPVIQSFEPGEDWVWCFEDEVFLEHRPVITDEARP